MLIRVDNAFVHIYMEIRREKKPSQLSATKYVEHIPTSYNVSAICIHCFINEKKKLI